ncbi:MAG: restriction endonuclease subunit S [Lawsonibacter sp.]|nr:restriction endonuclease subunit S [Lawsonibacter sp.]
MQYVFGYVALPIEAVAQVKCGVRVIRSQLSDKGQYPVYQNSMTPLGYSDKKNCTVDTAFIISAGAAGEIGYSGSDFWAADDCIYFDCSEHLKSRFLYYVLQSRQACILTKVRKASVPRLSRTVIEKMIVSIPPLKEQERIISILDRFDTLCNDLTSGLPAEIEARQKQYEYYRDKLLTFKELSA